MHGDSPLLRYEWYDTKKLFTNSYKSTYTYYSIHLYFFVANKADIGRKKYMVRKLGRESKSLKTIVIYQMNTLNNKSSRFLLII